MTVFFLYFIKEVARPLNLLLDFVINNMQSGWRKNRSCGV